MVVMPFIISRLNDVLQLWLSWSDTDSSNALNCNSAVDCGFKPWSNQRLELVFGASPLSTQRWKSKDWLAQNQDNVSEWSNMSPYGLWFQWGSKIIIQLSMHVGLWCFRLYFVCEWYVYSLINSYKMVFNPIIKIILSRK